MVAKQSVLAKPLRYEVNLSPKEQLPGPFLVLSHLDKITAHSSLGNCGSHLLHFTLNL